MPSGKKKRQQLKKKQGGAHVNSGGSSLQSSPPASPTCSDAGSQVQCNGSPTASCSQETSPRDSGADPKTVGWTDSSIADSASSAGDSESLAPLAKSEAEKSTKQEENGQARYTGGDLLGDTTVIAVLENGAPAAVSQSIVESTEAINGSDEGNSVAAGTESLATLQGGAQVVDDQPAGTHLDGVAALALFEAEADSGEFRSATVPGPLEKDVTGTAVPSSAEDRIDSGNDPTPVRGCSGICAWIFGWDK